MLQIVAPGSGTTITGQVVVARHLVEVQHLCYELPTILVALKMGGEEEVPAGVVAVVTPCATDILCHSAIRARNNRVLLATCHDQARLEEICAAAGRWASMAVQGRAADLDVVLGVEPAVAGGGQQGEPAGEAHGSHPTRADSTHPFTSLAKHTSPPSQDTFPVFLLVVMENHLRNYPMGNFPHSFVSSRSC